MFATVGIVAVRVETRNTAQPSGVSSGLGVVAEGGIAVGSSGLVAGQISEVTCSVWGSRPPPTVVWWMGSQKMTSTNTKVRNRNGCDFPIARNKFVSSDTCNITFFYL